MTNPERDEELALYVISVAAELSGLHPQTLRQYDRLGLVSPRRTPGGIRRYTASEVELLRSISTLVNEGINIAGVKRIMKLEFQLENISSLNPET